MCVVDGCFKIWGYFVVDVVFHGGGLWRQNEVVKKMKSWCGRRKHDATTCWIKWPQNN